MLPFYLLSLIVTAKAELLPGSCSFQDSICDYMSDPDFLSWTLDPSGHFITVEEQVQEDQGKAVLLGPDVEQQDWSCFRMVYQVTGSTFLQVQKRTDGESFDQVLWTTQSPSESWLIASIDLQNSTETFKIVIEGKLGEEEGSSVSIFEIKISDKYCIECDFEEDHLCGYTNEWNRYMNWRVGRSDDTALNDGTGQYMFVDSTDTKSFQEVAKLVSPMTTVPMSGCLNFQYQQYHAGDHLFTLFSRDQAGQYQELWRADLPENNNVNWSPETRVWIPVQVDLKAPYPIELVFEVAFNGPHGGYVILDEISFSPEFCNAGTEPTFDPSVANCDFESGYCRYVQTQIDSSLWRRVSVRPNIYTAGDHTTGAGSFLLANSRFSLQSGYVSRLFGPPMPGNQKYCLKFFYSLRGLSGTDQVLSAYLYYGDGSKQEPIWTQNYKIRNVWIAVELTIQSQKNAQVVFISTCKNIWSCGSVGLDDIKVTLGDCALLASSVSAPSHCDFEAGLCGFTQDKEGDSGDWMLARGPTPTSYTGPRGDHTTGVGHYLHIEASVMLAGHKARLLSSSLRVSRKTQCLQFYYHMYGSGIGQLSVYLQTGQENQDKLLWTSHGEQGISWLRASVNYQCDRQHQIVFEATRGASVRSDIAIDDVVFERGPCREYADDHIPHLRLSGNNNDIQSMNLK
ncbi:MAM domain-containing protein 2 [Sinocyclocheilus rhinocerous]|uniref:Structural maintenance of chromosomes protein 5-like n=1 Tax=Sinocyclocheilus rhinocerous TaxID=307959 RepID=A0A673L878_9TELE|nr:PREDICTED: MAM domain-containing protein 2-like [Sinocyclocheilus rhinocerous]XP_016391672.1 PREDICTED: MAM domain-containing protein 2-like [Sinocyclocheilus rhinocerous]